MREGFPSPVKQDVGVGEGRRVGEKGADQGGRYVLYAYMGVSETFDMLVSMKTYPRDIINSKHHILSQLGTITTTDIEGRRWGGPGSNIVKELK
jgi:hypothetical protein